MPMKIGECDIIPTRDYELIKPGWRWKILTFYVSVYTKRGRFSFLLRAQINIINVSEHRKKDD